MLHLPDGICYAVGMSASLAMKRTISRPRKPLDPMWYQALLMSVSSSGGALFYAESAVDLAVRTGGQPLLVGAAAYSAYSVVLAFRNLARTGETIINYYTAPDLPARITPDYSIKVSLTSASHAATASFASCAAIALVYPGSDLAARYAQPWEMGKDLMYATIFKAAALLHGHDKDDDDKKPPKGGSSSGPQP